MFTASFHAVSSHHRDACSTPVQQNLKVVRPMRIYTTWLLSITLRLSGTGHGTHAKVLWYGSDRWSTRLSIGPCAATRETQLSPCPPYHDPPYAYYKCTPCTHPLHATRKAGKAETMDCVAHLAGRDVLCNKAQERHHGEAACDAANS